MIFYKRINKAMRSADRSSIGMIAYQYIISPVVEKINMQEAISSSFADKIP